MAEQESAPSPTLRRLPVPRWLLWVLGILLGIALLLYIASYFIDEPLRKATEDKVNRDLKGYSVSIPKLHLQLDRALAHPEGSHHQERPPRAPRCLLPRRKQACTGAASSPGSSSPS